MYHARELTVSTRGRGFHDITSEVQRAIQESGVRQGLCTVFLHHTSASLILCENADPDVRRDTRGLLRPAREGWGLAVPARRRGPGRMPAHVRTVLTQNSLSIPIQNGSADLGTWQGLYVWEHRTSPHRRRVTVSVLG